MGLRAQTEPRGGIGFLDPDSGLPVGSRRRREASTAPGSTSATPASLSPAPIFGAVTTKQPPAFVRYGAPFVSAMLPGTARAGS